MSTLNNVDKGERIVAVNINFFLKQKYEQYMLPEAIRTYELYNNISNEHLRNLFAILHQEFNKLFRFMYSKSNGHYNAAESRKLIEYINLYEDMQYVLKNTSYYFEINSEYRELINICKGFLEESGGSPIPDDLKRIYIIEYEPIFTLATYIKIPTIVEEKQYPIHLIGEGSYAQVFKYRDEFYDKDFVIKRAKKDLNEKEIERFKKEYAIMKELNSPYILEVYRYDDQKNEYYAEYAEQTLYDYISKNNAEIKMETRRSIAYQIFRAFSYIHSKGYWHRDISLTNVLLNFYEDIVTVKISDFGLVKEKDSNLTSIDTEVKGSLNDSQLSVIGFKNYSMIHETYALTRLILFVMTGKRNLEKINDEKIKNFILKGTNSDTSKRFKSVDEMKEYFRKTFE